MCVCRIIVGRFAPSCLAKFEFVSCMFVVDFFLPCFHPTTGIRDLLTMNKASGEPIPFSI